MKTFTCLLLFLSITLNIILGFNIFFHKPSSSQAQAFSEINAPGIYDFIDMDFINGDATINAADVKLLNTVVTGNLYVTEKVGDGSLELKNVIVEGSVIVSGGGENSIVLEDCRLKDLMVNRNDGRVRVNAQGKTVVENTYVMSGTILVERNLSPHYYGFKNVHIKTSNKTELFGEYEYVTVETENAEVSLITGLIERLVVTKEANGANILILDEAVAVSLELYAAASVSGKKLIEIIVVDAPGPTKLSGQYVTVIARGSDSSLEIYSGSIENLIVEESGIYLYLHENVSVVNLELFGTALVEGQGTIELLIIKSPGSIIEQTPTDFQIIENITAIIAGKEMPDITSEPETIPDTAPQQKQGTSPEPSAETEQELDELVTSLDFTFEVKDSLMPAKKIVLVKLTNTSNPGDYKLYLLDNPLIYIESQQVFYGEINEEDALQGNVKVRKK